MAAKSALGCNPVPGLVQGQASEVSLRARHVCLLECDLLTLKLFQLILGSLQKCSRGVFAIPFRSIMIPLPESCHTTVTR